MNEELSKLVEACRGKTMTPEEIKKQRISFVYGNAPKDDKGTRQTVIKSLEVCE